MTDLSNVSESAPSESKYVCVNCMKPVESLYTEYSKEVIRITECSKCKKIADKYIEYDTVLIFNDLFLQYSAAYRHLLLNTNFESYARIGMLFILADAYNKWILRQTHLQSARVYDLEWHFYEALIKSSLECFTYLLTSYFLSLYIIGKNSKMHPFKFFVGRSVVGFFGNIFVVFSIIWHLHEYESYRLLMKLFIFISQIQVQKTLCPSLTTTMCVIIVMISIAARVGIGFIFSYFISTFSTI
uniref:Protein ARV n=1 Tax=Panagrolaimus davidi TaxID=227884 RepID=A0A914QR57_9BILA